MILLSTLTAIVLLIAAAVICIHTYEHITRRRTTIKKGENIMADENNEEKPKTEEKVVEQPKNEEPKKTEEQPKDAAGSHDDELEKVISDALKSIGRGKDDKTKEESEQKKGNSSDVDIDDIVSRVVERINADSSKKNEDSSKSQTALIAAAIMGAAQPKKEDPWDLVKKNLENRLGHK